MEKISLLFLLSLIVFSCQKAESKKIPEIALKTNNQVQNQDSKKENEFGHDVLIQLPNDRYAFITLESYKDKSAGEESETYYRPTLIKVFDKKTKKEVPETLLTDIYYTGKDDQEVWYGDFNFDGKMDVVCQGKYSGYRTFSHYNFYLATLKGYELNKNFAVLTEPPIATIELDAKNKKFSRPEMQNGMKAGFIK